MWPFFKKNDARWYSLKTCLAINAIIFPNSLFQTLIFKRKKKESLSFSLFCRFCQRLCRFPLLTTEPTSLHMSVFLTSALDMFEVRGNLFSVFRVGLIFVTLSQGQPRTAGSAEWKWSVCWHICDSVHKRKLIYVYKEIMIQKPAGICLMKFNIFIFSGVSVLQQEQQ